MRSELHKELIKSTEDLRGNLSQFSTESIVGFCEHKLRKWFSNGDDNTSLISPLKQIFFLFGLMLTSSEPETPLDFDNDEFISSVNSLNSIFLKYSEMYWPSDKEIPDLPQGWKQNRTVSMATFLHYFNTANAITHFQSREWVIRYFIPFDSNLTDLINISASQILEITDWIHEYLQLKLNEFTETVNSFRIAQQDIMKKAVEDSWSIDRIRQESFTGDHASVFKKMPGVIINFNKIEKSDIQNKFGKQVSNKYWDLFVSVRGSINAFSYITERNPAIKSPIFELQNGVGICPSLNVLYTSLLDVIEDTLSNSSNPVKFFESRSKFFEEEVLDQFNKLFKNSASIIPNSYETKNLRDEHDLIIIWQDKVFVIESKSSSPREPFRDPEKAFVRIRDDFRSDVGIQKAYNQSINIYKKLSSGKNVNLYDSNRRKTAELKPKHINSIYCICITRNDFGPLAVDLSLLLEKEEEDPYPWSINIIDLNFLFNGFQYLNLGPKEFCEFLDKREKLHGKIISFDELEIAGFFIEHGSLDFLISSESPFIQLDPSYSNVFDKIYAVTLNRPHYTHVIKTPIFKKKAPNLVIVSPSNQ